MTQARWTKLGLVAVLLAMVASFAIGGNGCDFLSKKDDKKPATVSTGSSAPVPVEEYSFGLKVLSNEEYNQIPQISAPAMGIDALPAEWYLTNKMPTPRSQGGQGSCVGWAVAYSLKTYQEQSERNWGVNTDAHLFSPAYIYNQINRGQDNGSFIYEALNLLTAQGCATLATMPYASNDFLTQPSAQAITEAQNYKVVLWRSVNILDRTEIKRFLKSGYPLVIAIKVGSNFYYNQNIRNSNYIYSSFGDTILGLHAVTLVGYSDNKSAFMIMNSWGTNWGDNGYAWIDYNFFPQACRESYYVQDYIVTTKTGSISVISTPINAEVYLNDIFKGATPITITNVTTNDYTVKVSKPGYKDKEFPVTVTENQVATVNVTLELNALPAPALVSPGYNVSTDDTTPTFDWSDVTGAVTYGIQVDNDFDFSSPVVDQTTTSSNYTPTTAMSVGSYFWKVRTYNNIGVWGTWSSARLFSVNLQPPSAPSILTATAVSSSEILLTWYDNSNNETGFYVEKKIGASGTPVTATIPANATSNAHSGLSASTTYYFRIRAYNSIGLSAYSTEVSATTQPAPVTTPTAPSGLSATVISSSQIRLNWIDNSTNEEEFKVETKIGIDGAYTTITTGANTSSMLHFDLSSSTTYYYRIKAYNSSGDSAYSNEVNATTDSVSDWSRIASSGYHTVAIKTNGTLWTWGANSLGQLGLGDTATRKIPTQVGTDSNWSAIACGENHTLAIKTNGALWAWGNNSAGQLGVGDTNNRHSPTQIAGDWSGAYIGCGWYHNFVLKTNGALWVWGKNDQGQLGLGNTTLSQTSPVQMGTDTDWFTVAGGGWDYTIARKTNKTLWAWGLNNMGQLGLGDTARRTSPTQIGTDTDWLMVTSGGYHSIALKSNWTLWVWGGNANNQLGLGDTTDRNVPVQVGTDTDWFAPAGGKYHTLVLKNNGVLWGWGNNGAGQLGIGDWTNRNTPVQIGSASDWRSYVSAGQTSVFLKTDGTLWVWGANVDGQLGLGDTTSRNVPTQVGQ